MKYSVILLLVMFSITGCSDPMESKSPSETLPREELFENSNSIGCALPHIKTTVYFLHVPADWSRPKDILMEDITFNEMISPQNLGEILSAVNNDPKARLLSRPQILTNNKQEGRITTSSGKDGDETLNMKIKHHIDPDENSIRTEIVLMQSSKTDQGNITKSTVESTLTLLPGHAFALRIFETKEDANLLLIQPEFFEIDP